MPAERLAIRRARAFVVGLTAALALSTPAVAFEPLDYSWRDNKAHFRINPSFPLYPAFSNPELSGTAQQQLDILLCAAAAWRDQTAADFEFVYDGTTARRGFNIGDGVNTISWVDADAPDALAATVIDGIGSRATDFDIVFFGSTGGIENKWNGPQDPVSGTFDIGGIAVHELGHALGLDHTSIREATMYASARSRGLPLRTLDNDDRAGVEFLYGTRPANEVHTGPLIQLVQPENGPTTGGNEVVLRGRNFTWTADTTLEVNGQLVSRTHFEVESHCTLTIRSMPPGPVGPVDLRLTNELGTTIVENGYRYGAPAPQITGIEPALGPVSGKISVTISGESLEPGAVITIGGRLLEDVVVLDPQTLIGILPTAPAAGTVDVRLQQGPESDELLEAFTYTAKVLAVAKTAAAAGQGAVPVEVLASTDEALSALSFGILYPSDQLAIDSVTVLDTVAEDAEFAEASIDNDGGITTFGLVMSFTGRETPNIPAGNDQLTATIVSSVAATVPVASRIPITLEDEVGIPPIRLIFTPLGTSTEARPFTVNGEILVTEGPTFLRGDTDGNEILQITDAVRVLEALFRGNPPFLCEDAADSNDDGRLDISDAVYLLLFLFSGGDPPPPPYPEPGPDPTPDDLSCEL